MKTPLHDIRNHLAIASANIEAFIDGKMQPTPGRLRTVLAALNEVDVLLSELPGAAGEVHSDAN